MALAKDLDARADSQLDGSAALHALCYKHLHSAGDGGSFVCEPGLLVVRDYE